jgi:hypothetical protein
MPTTATIPSAYRRQPAWNSKGGFHTLQLLTEYLAGCAGRKRQIVASEIKTLQELYEATWSELGCAFPAGLIRRARSAVELGAAADYLRRSAVGAEQRRPEARASAI